IYGEGVRRRIERAGIRTRRGARLRDLRGIRLGRFLLTTAAQHRRGRNGDRLHQTRHGSSDRKGWGRGTGRGNEGKGGGGGNSVVPEGIAYQTNNAAVNRQRRCRYAGT